MPRILIAVSLADESLRLIPSIQLSFAHDRKVTGGSVGPAGDGGLVGGGLSNPPAFTNQSLHSGQYPVCQSEGFSSVEERERKAY